ncbi:aldehyde ferredoxin oxidoreductase family protein [Chloroflexota bacterium]
MSSYGYGKMLHVDLSARKIEKRETEPEFARKFGGGMGFGCKILYDEVGPDIDPLSPDNVIVVASGPLTGTQAPFASRTEVTTRDPLTGSVGSGNTGGMLGPYLKHAGFQAIVIRGKAENPVYLWINDDEVEIRDADHLWGRDAYETTDILKRENGESKASVFAIGTAGENLVKYSCPVTDYYHFAARSGAGPVMGYKKLKAIVVRGTGTVNIARPEEFQSAVKEARERILSRQSNPAEHIIKNTVDKGSLPGKNFQTGFMPQFLETRGQEVAQKYFSKKLGTCYACPQQCINLIEINEGKYLGLKYAPGLRPGMTFAWGATCGINNLPAVWKCMYLCSRLGLDYCSASNSIAFTMELFQRGLITKADTDGLELSWGNEDAVMEMLSRIASRKGFGDVLADGVIEAARKIGKGAEQYAMTTKGREMAWQDPRSANRGFIFGYLTNPRGGDNLKSTHFEADEYSRDWWVDKFDIFEDVKEKIYCVPPEEISSSWEGKAAMCKWFEDLYSAVNALGVCIFPAGLFLTIGPTHLSQLYSACTGWDTTPREMMKLGERVFHLLKAYTIRQGLSRKDDSFPNRFYTEQLPEGPTKGAVLSREDIGKLLDEYYELRDWDKKSGLPTESKLVELGLADVAKDLSDRGKLPEW